MKLVNTGNATGTPAPLEVVGPIVGELVAVTEDGAAIVDYPGNVFDKLIARTLVSIPPSQAVSGMPVLLQFEKNQADCPIILGIVGDQLVSNAIKSLTLNSDLLSAALVDGKKVRIDAKDEIELVCGRSSILLRKDGRIVIKGMEVTSRAAKTNKIRGGSVTIN